MRASVIVPLFNKAPYVKRTLDSIAAQTLSDFEVIIIDDGSTDGGDKIAERYPDPRFRLIRQANAGPGATRNHGAREATAPYIAFLDADDAWRPGFLESGSRILDKHPAASVSTAWIDLPRNVLCTPVWTRRGISEGLHRVAPDTPVGIFDAMVGFITPCTTLLRADVFRQCGGFQEGGCRFGEDGMLWLKMLFNFPVFFHLEPLVDLYRDASGLSGNYKAARPLEPYLLAPDTLLSSCPAELHPLLHRFYARRACKTACMLSYWGEWRRARQLLQQFVTLRDWKAPLFGTAFAVSTPAGALAGKLYRKFRA